MEGPVFLLIVLKRFTKKVKLNISLKKYYGEIVEFVLSIFKSLYHHLPKNVFKIHLHPTRYYNLLLLTSQSVRKIKALNFYENLKGLRSGYGI